MPGLSWLSAMHPPGPSTPFDHPTLFTRTPRARVLGNFTTLLFLCSCQATRCPTDFPFGTRDCYYSASQEGPRRRLLVVEQKGLRVYARMSRLPFPRSYLGKLLLAAFLGIHVPLIALVLYLLALSPPIGFGTKLSVFAIVLVATLLGTCATLCVLYLLLKP